MKSIDDSDTSILSSTATLKLKRIVTPTINAITKYTISFNNVAYHPSASWAQTVVESTGFYLDGNSNEQFIDDDGNSNIRTFYLLGGTTKTITNAEAGTINYNTGEVVLTSFNIGATTNTNGTIDVTIKPDSNDIIPVRQQVIEIDTVATTVTAEVDEFATGSATAGVGYSTSSSTASVGSTYTTS